MRALQAFVLLTLPACSIAEGPVRQELQIFEYPEDHPRVQRDDFPQSVVRFSVGDEEEEYALIAVATGDTVTLGAKTTSRGQYEALFRMVEPITFPIGPDARGEVPAPYTEGRTALAGESDGFQWVLFEIPRAELPEGSPLSLTFIERSWAAGDRNPDVALARRPLTEGIVERQVHLPPFAEQESEPGMRVQTVFEVHYVGDPPKRDG